MVTGKIIHQLQHDYLYNGLVVLKNRSFVRAEGIDNIKGIGFYTTQANEGQCMELGTSNTRPLVY